MSIKAVPPLNMQLSTQSIRFTRPTIARFFAGKVLAIGSDTQTDVPPGRSVASVLKGSNPECLNNGAFATYNVGSPAWWTLHNYFDGDIRSGTNHDADRCASYLHPNSLRRQTADPFSVNPEQHSGDMYKYVHKRTRIICNKKLT